MTNYRQMLIDRAKDTREAPDQQRTDHIALANRQNYADWQYRKYLHELGYAGGVFHVERRRWWQRRLM